MCCVEWNFPQLSISWIYQVWVWFLFVCQKSLKPLFNFKFLFVLNNFWNLCVYVLILKLFWSRKLVLNVGITFFWHTDINIYFFKEELDLIKTCLMQMYDCFLNQIVIKRNSISMYKEFFFFKITLYWILYIV